MTTRKVSNVNVTIKPWYHTPLLTAILGASIGLIPYGCDRLSEREIVSDNIGFSHLFVDEGTATFTFSSSTPLSVDAKVIAGTFESLDSWIAFNTGQRTVKIARGMHNGRFSGIARNLMCGAKYFYRVEAKLHGRIIVGPQGWINTLPCETAEQIDATKQHPAYRASL